MTKQLVIGTKIFFGLALIVLIRCAHKTEENDFARRWESEIKLAIDSCPIRNVKVYYLRDLDFIKRNNLRSKIVNGVSDDWNQMEVIESFGDDSRDYFASVLLDDSLLYAVNFQKESRAFLLKKVSRENDQFERMFGQFEDFPSYKIECDSSANSIFFFRGKRNNKRL